MTADDKDDGAHSTIANGTAVRQLSVFLHNRVGTLMALVRLLHENSIDVLSLSVQESTELTIVRLILTDPELAETVFIERGIPHACSEIVVVELPAGNESLRRCLASLLSAEINVRLSYPILVQTGLHPRLALHLEDPDMGTEALEKSGFRTLRQEDLSR